MKKIFIYRNYKTYLKDYLAELSQSQKGAQSLLADHMGCQKAYLSNVLRREVHLTLEQSEKANSFFHHNEIESHFFISLVSFNRAGTTSLKKYYKTQMDNITKQQLTVQRQKDDVRKVLGDKEMMEYYSEWYYSAVFCLVSIPKYQVSTIECAKLLSEALSLKEEKVMKIIHFLKSCDLLVLKKDKLKHGETLIHLDKKSSLIRRHHFNWRIKAMSEIDRDNDEHLHFSTVFSLEKSDLIKIKETLLTSIDISRSIIRSSKEEEIFCLNMDLFQVNQ